MRLSGSRVRQLCREKGLHLSRMLRMAGVSRNAYYSLLRKDSVLPKSVTALARQLNVTPSAFLEETLPQAEKTRRLREKLDTIMKKKQRGRL